MLKKRIIPCLDIKDGRVVKGINFENLIDAGDIIKQAEFFYQEGADELCVLDISATNEEREVLYETVKNISKVCFIPLCIGGGIKEISQIQNLLLSGADKVSINSAAVKNPQLISEAANKFGAQAIVVAIDAKKNAYGDYEIFTNSSKISTGINALDFAKKMENLGAGEILLTSINQDGTKQGYDLELLSSIANNVNIPVIASGGAGSLEHLQQAFENQASAVLAASIFHFKEFSIKQAKEFLKNKSIPIRL